MGDYEAFSSINVQGIANNFALQTIDDNITLEYDDKVILVFTLFPQVANLSQTLEARGEYLRDTAIVAIIDNDGRGRLMRTD